MYVIWRSHIGTERGLGQGPFAQRGDGHGGRPRPVRSKTICFSCFCPWWLTRQLPAHLVRHLEAMGKCVSKTTRSTVIQAIARYTTTTLLVRKCGHFGTQMWLVCVPCALSVFPDPQLQLNSSVHDIQFCFICFGTDVVYFHASTHGPDRHTRARAHATRRRATRGHGTEKKLSHQDLAGHYPTPHTRPRQTAAPGGWTEVTAPVGL